jgi:enoyl-CoA hydratase/carnithine racemase
MLSTISLEQKDSIAVLTLQDNVTNALSPEMVMELSTIIGDIKKDCRGLLVCGGSKFFSIGLALPKLLPLKRPAMANFWKHFNQVLLDLYTLPIPTLSILEGHAVAGGNIVAVTTDYRFALDEEKKIGLNEITLGLPVPFFPEMIVKQIVGERAAFLMMDEGNFMTFSEAAQIGLIDKLYSEQELHEKAFIKISKMAGFEQSAFALMKANRTSYVRQQYEQYAGEQHERFLDCWFSESVQKILHKAAESF